MGVNGLLPRILPSAGRENYDLRALADGIVSLAPPQSPDDDEPAPKRRRWTRRKVRVAVDVNGWIARAAHGFGGSNMDVRHMSYHGRAHMQFERNLEDQQAVEGQQQPQQQLEEECGDQEQANQGADKDQNAKQESRLEYITKCTSFVLSRIEYLRDECGTLVLPVLDGATPPCKLEAVRERSNRRKKATEERDEVAAQSPPRPSNADDDAIAEEEEEEENEAARTEAEVLRRISASKRAGTGKDRALRREMLDELLKEFRQRGWPFVVAPYEADGQLARLATAGAVDVVVTEDSDLIAYGVPSLVYKLGGWNGTNAANRAGVGSNDFGNVQQGGGTGWTGSQQSLRGTLLHRCDLGAAHGIDLMDFSDAMLATLFVAAGCDYCDSLKGIGVVTARNIVEKAFRGEGSGAVGDEPVLRLILDDLFRSCHQDARRQVLPLDDPEKEEVRLAYEQSFLAALAMFRHPVVYDPILGEHVVANDVCDDGNGSATVSASFMRDEKILMGYGPYRDLVTNRERLYQVVGTPFSPEMAKAIAQGLIDPREMQKLTESSASQDNEDANGVAAVLENNSQQAEEGTESRDLTQGSSSGVQLSSQEFSGAGTQQSKSSSAASGMISSLSPDLLAASPSPQKPS